MTESKNSQMMATTVQPGQRLLVSGLVHLNQSDHLVELRRGMRLQALDAPLAGTVAAVIMICHSQVVSHFLIGHIPLTAEYQLAPVCLIQRIAGNTVWLRETCEGIAQLPQYHADR